MDKKLVKHLTVSYLFQNWIITSENVIENYRNYYKYGKDHLHKWTKREPPVWLKDI